MIRFSVSLMALSGLIVFSPLAAKNELPQTTADGLVLQSNTEVAAVYLEPGATLDGYDKVMLVDAYVAFKKNWQRDYNRTRAGLGEDVRNADIDRMKKDVASEFAKIFAEVLTEGGYEVTEEAGPDVLLIRPAIINLDVTAPDLNSPGMRRVIISSAGSMSLYMELHDSVTSDMFAVVYDYQADRERGFGMPASKSTNKQAFDRIVKYWAGLMVEGLDEAHGKNQ